MTPCEEMGYRAGDLFLVVGNPYGPPEETKGVHYPAHGDLVKLTADDCSDIPYFEVIVSSAGAEGRKTCLKIPSVNNPDSEVTKLEGQD